MVLQHFDRSKEFSPFSFLIIRGCDVRSPECSRETRFDMIILQLSSPLCHMPDLSVGRGMQLALLTINQLDGGGGRRCLWRRWDGTALAPSGCFANIALHTQTHTTHTADFYICGKKLEKTSWFSILPFAKLASSLLCASFACRLLLFCPSRSSVAASFLLLFKSLQHPSPPALPSISPNSLSTESSSEGPAGRVHKMDEI